MTAGGWLMLIFSWGVIAALTVVTVWRTMRSKTGGLSAPLELEADIEKEDAKKEEGTR